MDIALYCAREVITIKASKVQGNYFNKTQLIAVNSRIRNISQIGLTLIIYFVGLTPCKTKSCGRREKVLFYFAQR